MTAIDTTMQQCAKELKIEFWKATAATLKIQNKKNAKKNIEDTWNEKPKERDDIFCRYYRNK